MTDRSFDRPRDGTDQVIQSPFVCVALRCKEPGSLSTRFLPYFSDFVKVDRQNCLELNFKTLKSKKRTRKSEYAIVSRHILTTRLLMMQRAPFFDENAEFDEVDPLSIIEDALSFTSLLDIPTLFEVCE